MYTLLEINIARLQLKVKIKSFTEKHFKFIIKYGKRLNV